MTMLIALLGVSAIVVVIWWLSRPALDREVGQAIVQKDIPRVVAHISRMRNTAQTSAYNHAIRRLWDAYERPLATTLIKSLVEQHPSSLITQYWLDQLRSVEPGLAVEILGQDFFTRYFKPDVAATCGQFG